MAELGRESKVVTRPSSLVPRRSSRIRPAVPPPDRQLFDWWVPLWAPRIESKMSISMEQPRKRQKFESKTPLDGVAVNYALTNEKSRQNLLRSAMPSAKSLKQFRRECLQNAQRKLPRQLPPASERMLKYLRMLWFVYNDEPKTVKDVVLSTGRYPKRRHRFRVKYTILAALLKVAGVDPSHYANTPRKRAEKDVLLVQSFLELDPLDNLRFQQVIKRKFKPLLQAKYAKVTTVDPVLVDKALRLSQAQCGDAFALNAMHIKPLQGPGSPEYGSIGCNVFLNTITIRGVGALFSFRIYQDLPGFKAISSNYTRPEQDGSSKFYPSDGRDGRQAMYKIGWCQLTDKTMLTPVGVSYYSGIRCTGSFEDLNNGLERFFGNEVAPWWVATFQIPVCVANLVGSYFG